eukprot:1818237-Rhodomonas_salina.1
MPSCRSSQPSSAPSQSSAPSPPNSQLYHEHRFFAPVPHVVIDGGLISRQVAVAACCLHWQ